MSEALNNFSKFNSNTLNHDENNEKFSITNYITPIPRPYIKVDMDIYDAVKILLEHKLTGVPILGDKEELLGFLSEKDCLKSSYDSRYNGLPAGLVNNYISKDVISVNSDAELFEVVDMFIKNNFQSYPVLENGKVVGIITRRSVFEAVAEYKESYCC